MPMNPWSRRRASSWARTRTLRARSVNRSNVGPVLHHYETGMPRYSDMRLDHFGCNCSEVLSSVHRTRQRPEVLKDQGPPSPQPKGNNLGMTIPTLLSNAGLMVTLLLTA